MRRNQHFNRSYQSESTILYNSVVPDKFGDAGEEKKHSFVIKIWLEELNDRTNKNVWRGHITHVPDGKRQHIRDLDSIIAFIIPYLNDMGVKIPFCWQIRQHLGRYRKHFIER